MAVTIEAPSRWRVRDAMGGTAGILYVDEVVCGPYGTIAKIRWHWAGGKRREDDPAVVRELLERAEKAR